jgi:hypothetical protein
MKTSSLLVSSIGIFSSLLHDANKLIRIIATTNKIALITNNFFIVISLIDFFGKDINNFINYQIYFNYFAKKKESGCTHSLFLTKSIIQQLCWLSLMLIDRL